VNIVWNVNKLALPFNNLRSEFYKELSSNRSQDVLALVNGKNWVWLLLSWAYLIATELFANGCKKSSSWSVFRQILRQEILTPSRAWFVIYSSTVLCYSSICKWNHTSRTSNPSYDSQIATDCRFSFCWFNEWTEIWKLLTPRSTNIVQIQTDYLSTY
jgi:hypothetical protein